MKRCPTPIDCMDLRDYFAGKVMPYLAADHKEEMIKADYFDGWTDLCGEPTFDAEMVAKDAYAIADAMMEARKQ